jgi:hypothetical protein
MCDTLSLHDALPIYEEDFLNEQVEHLRRQGLTSEELDAFVRQAVGTDIGNPEN